MREYINIQKWMMTELGLSGHELLTYAIIFGFSMDGESKFKGSRKYIADWLNCSLKTVTRTLASLCDKGVIIKDEEVINGVRLCRYYIPRESMSEGGDIMSPVGTNRDRGRDKMSSGRDKMSRGRDNMSPDNISDNIEDNIEDKNNNPLYIPQGGNDVEFSVERVYAEYPGRDKPTSNYPKGRSLGKCSNDKDKIRRLLASRKYTEEQLISIIRQEIAEHPNGYMKNFSTFLNNIPDFTPDAKNTIDDKAARQAEKDRERRRLNNMGLHF